MPREDYLTKARRLLSEGRVTIRRVGAPTSATPGGGARSYATVVAEVRGDSAERYSVTYAPRGGWACSCPARSRCSHEQAVMLCTLPSAVIAPAQEAS